MLGALGILVAQDQEADQCALARMHMTLVDNASQLRFDDDLHV